MGRSSVTSPKIWQIVIIVLVISCGLPCEAQFPGGHVVINGLCNLSETVSSVDAAVRMYVRTSGDKSYRRIFLSPIQDNAEERSALYHFSLNGLTSLDILSYAEIQIPFFKRTTEWLTVSLSVKVIRANVTVTERNVTTERGNETHTDANFCLRWTVTRMVKQLLEDDNHNLTFDVLTSCQSSELETSQGCAVEHLRVPFLYILYWRRTPEVTTQPSIVELKESQAVAPGPCNFNETARAIFQEQQRLRRNGTIDDNLGWTSIASRQDPTAENSTLYSISLAALRTNDDILNATLFTSISMTDSPPTPNVNISVTITDANDINRQVQYTMVHNPAAGSAGFCHLGTLTRMVESMLQTGSRNLMVDVKTTCQFPSTAPEGMGCGSTITHPREPFLIVEYLRYPS